MQNPWNNVRAVAVIAAYLSSATTAEARFLQTDPVGYEDQINLYAYVENDPINARDPSGTYSCGSNLSSSQCENFQAAQAAALAKVNTSIRALSSLQKGLTSGKLSAADKATAAVLNKYAGSGAGGNASSVGKVLAAANGIAAGLRGNAPAVAVNGNSTSFGHNNGIGINRSFLDRPGTDRVFQGKIIHESSHDRNFTIDTSFGTSGNIYGRANAVERARLSRGDVDYTLRNADSSKYVLGFDNGD